MRRICIFSVLLIFLTIRCSLKNEKTIAREIEGIQVAESYTLPAPLKRFQYKEPFFYSYNYLSKELHKHDRGLVILDSLGGQGDAPYENRVVLNYHIFDDSRVGIFDSDKNIYKIQDWEDSIFVFFKIDRKFERGVTLNDSLVALSYSYGDDAKLGLARANILSGTYEEFDQANIELNEPLSSWIYEGKLLNDKRWLFAFSYLFTDFFKIDLSTNNIERLNYGYGLDAKKPEVFEIEGGYMAGDNTLYITDASIDKKYAYLLSNLAERDFPANRILDVYQLDGFRYVKSFLVPNRSDAPPDEVFTDDQFVYFRYEYEVIRTKLDL